MYKKGQEKSNQLCTMFFFFFLADQVHRYSAAVYCPLMSIIDCKQQRTAPSLTCTMLWFCDWFSDTILQQTIVRYTAKESYFPTNRLIQVALKYIAMLLLHGHYVAPCINITRSIDGVRYMNSKSNLTLTSSEQISV